MIVYSDSVPVGVIFLGSSAAENNVLGICTYGVTTVSNLCSLSYIVNRKPEPESAIVNI